MNHPIARESVYIDQHVNQVLWNVDIVLGITWPWMRVGKALAALEYLPPSQSRDYMLSGANAEAHYPSMLIKLCL